MTHPYCTTWWLLIHFKYGGSIPSFYRLPMCLDSYGNLCLLGVTYLVLQLHP